MTSTYLPYSQINSLEEFSFIAGSTYSLYFNVYEADGITPLDMGGSTFIWVLSRYGQSENIKELTGTITGIGTAVVEISKEDTETLSGKYIHQPVIVSFSGDEYRPAQGVLLIIPQIPLN